LALLVALVLDLLSVPRLSARLLLLVWLSGSAPIEPFPLSLHDALPICLLTAVAALVQVDGRAQPVHLVRDRAVAGLHGQARATEDRKRTRLNSSHVKTSYAVFCLKKKQPNLTILDLSLAKCTSPGRISR